MKLVKEGNDDTEDRTPLMSNNTQQINNHNNDETVSDDEERETFIEDDYIEDYDSDEEIEEEKNDKQLTWAQAFFSIVNMIQGMGTLGIPYAIKVGGYITILFVIFVGLVTKYTATMIIECQYDEEDIEERQQKEEYTNKQWDGDGTETNPLITQNEKMKKRRIKNRAGFAAIGRSVWTKYGAKIVSGIQLTHLFGACVLYLILVAGFLQNVVPPTFISSEACILLAGGVLLPTTLLTSFSAISWLSFISTILMDVVFVSLLTHSLANINHWNPSSLPFIDVEGLCIANCIVLFSFVAHPYLPRIEGNMAEPEKFNSVANFSFVSATFTKILFGIALAFSFGDNTQQRITANIELGKLRTLLETFLACSGLLSFPMPTNVIMNIIHHSDLEMFAKIFAEKRLSGIMTWSEKFVDIGLRVVLVAFTTTVALILPEFSLLMAVFGSVTAVSMTLLLPSIFHIVIKRKELSPTSLLIHYIIIGFGIMSSFVGLMSSMDSLRKSLAKIEE